MGAAGGAWSIKTHMSWEAGATMQPPVISVSEQRTRSAAVWVCGVIVLWQGVEMEAVVVSVAAISLLAVEWFYIVLHIARSRALQRRRREAIAELWN